MKNELACTVIIITKHPSVASRESIFIDLTDDNLNWMIIEVNYVLQPILH